MLKNLVIIIIIIIKLLIMYNNSLSKNEYNYQKYKIDFSSIFTLEEKEYQVIFYLESCPNCSLTLEIIKKRELYLKTSIYYVDLLEVNKENRIKTIDNIGINSYSEVYVNVAPLLFSIVDHTIINQIVSQEKICAFLQDIIFK